MKSIMQLVRQPIKTLTGMMMVATAVAVLSVCVGQSLAARETEKAMNGIFSTIALPTADYTKEADEWLQGYAADFPEVVKAVGSPGLISAYIQKLTPKIYTEHVEGSIETYLNNNYLLLPDPNGSEYTSAMMEITLTEIGAPSTQWLYTRDGVFEYLDVPSAGTYVEIAGVIENVVGLAYGYPDYTGYTVSSYIYMPSMEDLKDLGLTVGGRYLLYTTELFDNDRSLRSTLMINYPELREELQQPFDPDKLTVFDNELNRSVKNTYDIVASYQFEGFLYHISRWQFELLRHIYTNIDDRSAMPNLIWELDSDRNPVAVIQDYHTYMEKDGHIVSVTPEEYHTRYVEPTIVRLDTTAEEFLASEEAALWREGLYNIEINSHSFPVIGVDDMSLIADFAQSKAAIVEGRNFITQELSSGEKVCILSRSLAEQNGLSVGDTLSVQLFENDPGVPYQINISEGPGSARPTAYFFFDKTMDLEAEVEYTIIGLYDQERQWENIEDNLYTFSPNTIFVPEASVSAQMDYGYGAFFRTVRLQNGTIGEFQQAAAEAGYSGMFYFNDNGYATVEESMDSYRKVASRALVVGICVYTVVMLLFFLFFPIQQKPTLRIMETLGSKRTTQLKHMMCYCSAMLIPGTMLGVLSGMLLWKNVVDRLLQSFGTVMEVTVRSSTMLAVGGIQLIFVLFLALFTAVFVTNEKNLMKRR